jgi:hypothetical protein
VKVFIYIGEEPQEYPSLGIVATPGLFVEVDPRSVPKDGLWRAADGEDLAAYEEAASINAALE